MVARLGEQRAGLMDSLRWILTQVALCLSKYVHVTLKDSIAQHTMPPLQSVPEVSTCGTDIGTSVLEGLPAFSVVVLAVHPHHTPPHTHYALMSAQHTYSVVEPVCRTPCYRQVAALQMCNAMCVCVLICQCIIRLGGGRML